MQVRLNEGERKRGRRRNREWNAWFFHWIYFISPVLPLFLQGIWVEHVVKNPQYKIGEVREGSKDGGRGSNQLPPAFVQNLEEYVTGLPAFK
jgi:hypothetical protein